MRMPRLAGEARTGDDDESSEPVTSLRTRGELVAVDNAGCPKFSFSVSAARPSDRQPPSQLTIDHPQRLWACSARSRRAYLRFF
jgi:hypothetical protein